MAPHNVELLDDGVPPPATTYTRPPRRSSVARDVSAGGRLNAGTIKRSAHPDRPVGAPTDYWLSAHT